MKKSLIIAFSFLTISLFAQEQDPKAKAILDDASKISKTYKTTSANFILSKFNKDKKLVEKQDGKIQVKGQKFRLEIPGNLIVCDGKTIWKKDEWAVSDTTTSLENLEANPKLWPRMADEAAESLARKLILYTSKSTRTAAEPFM